MRFLRHDRIYRSDGAIFRSGRNTASRWSGPGRAIRRDGRSTPFPSLSMSSDRLFLDGLVATIARLRFTGTVSIKSWRLRAPRIIIEWKTVS